MREFSATLPSTTVEKFAQLADLLKQASLLAREISRSSEQLETSIPPDQKWFWSENWQAGEGEVDKALTNGEYEAFSTMEDAIAALHASL